MSIFQKSGRQHYFLELFKITDQQSASEFNTKELILTTVDLIQNATELEADDLSLNFESKSYKSIEGFKSHLQKHTVVHSHIGFNSNSSHTFFSVSNPMLNYTKDAKRPGNSTIEISLQVNGEYIDRPGMHILAEELIQKFRFEYGYIHTFPTRKFQGEKKLKKGLLSTSVSVDKTDQIWRNHQIGILHGYLKKLYYTNYLNKSQQGNSLIADFSATKGEIKTISDDITRWTLSDDEFQNLSRSAELEDVCIVTEDSGFLDNPIASQLKDLTTVRE